MANRLFPDQPDPGDRDEADANPNHHHSIGTYLILPDHTFRRCSTLEWAMSLEDTFTRQVAEDHLGVNWVSTVFLGLDHNHSGEGPPVLFETMVFKMGRSSTQRRYRTWDEAVAGHQEVLEELRQWIKNQ
jgi:hypothetical protein